MLAACVSLIALDQAVKRWAVNNLRGESTIVIIEGFFGLHYTTNQGMAFGLFQGGRWFFVISTLLAVVIIIFYEKSLPATWRSFWFRVPLTLILAGALGNFIDRLLHGEVVDMFRFLFINFPIFNVADICIVTGAFIYIFAVFFVKEA